MRCYLIIPIVLLLVLGACAPKEEDTIKIGANLALTGKLSLYGTNEYNGLKLAVQDINSKGGVDGQLIELIVEDNQGDAKNAIAAMKKLIDVDQAEVLFTAFTHITQAIAPLAQEANKILLYQSTLSDMAKASPFVFRDYMDTAVQGKELGRFILTEGHINIAYIGEGSDACEAFFTSLSEGLEKEGRVVLKENFDVAEKDFRTYLLKAKEAHPDAIVFCAWRSEDLLMPQANEIRLLEIPSFHAVAPFLPSANSANEFFKKNRAVSTWYGFTPRTQNKRIKEFIGRYSMEFGSAPSPDALYAYDDLMFLAQAMESCGSTDKECISEELITKNYQGIAGTLDFDQYGISTRPTLLIRYEEDGWEEIAV